MIVEDFEEKMPEKKEETKKKILQKLNERIKAREIYWDQEEEKDTAEFE